MENITSAISVQVDLQDKEMANDILKSLGLNMSTYVNMAIKQLLYTNGLPFEVKNPTQKNEMKINNIDELAISNNNLKKESHELNDLNKMPNLYEFLSNE